MRPLHVVATLSGALALACTGELGPAGVGGPGEGTDDDVGGAVGTSADRLIFDTPARGAMIERSAGPRVTVSGHSVPGERLEINGQDVEVAADGAFSIELDAREGVNVIEAEVSSSPKIQAARSFIYGDFIAPGALVDGAVALRINDQGFDDGDQEVDDVARMSEVAIASRNLAGELRGLRGSLSGGVSWRVLDARMGEGEVSFQPRDGGLRATVRIPSPYLRWEAAKGCLFTTCHLTGRVNADAAVVTANVGLRLVDGGLDIDMTNVTVELPGFDNDLDGAAGVFESIVSAVVGDVDTKLRNAARDAIRDMIPDSLNVGLSSLAVPSRIEIPELGLALDIAQRFDRVAFGTDGGEIGIAVGVSAPLEPGAPGEGKPGSLRLGAGTSTFRTEPEFGLTASLDLVNQIFFAGWAQGALVLDLAEGTFESPGPALGAIHATLLAPPVITPAEDGSLSVAVGDLELETTIDGVSSRIALSFRSRAHVELDPASSVGRLVLDGSPTIQAELVEGPEGLVGVLLTTFLETNVPALLQGAIGSLTFPLPEVPLDAIGMGDQVLRIAEPEIVVGAPRERVSFYGRLVVR